MNSKEAPHDFSQNQSIQMNNTLNHKDNNICLKQSIQATTLSVALSPEDHHQAYQNIQTLNILNILIDKRQAIKEKQQAIK